MSRFAQAYAVAEAVVRSAPRLAAVQATGLLDSEIEESFDRLTRLAVRLVRIPAAFVSLVDEHRDFYKSACGFGEPLASARQLEGPTFCHFTVQSSEPLVIPDTRADPVYRDVPTVTSLGVAAYVGIPILVNGQPIGAFCAIDMKPRDWTADEIEILKELAAVAVQEISLRASRAEAERFRDEAQLLAERLADQAEELHRARVEADRANQAKSDFLAAMSHDLRTPLNAIGGFAQLMELGIQGPVTAEQKDSIARMNRAQQHLLGLIDDILRFAKVESGEVELRMQPVELNELCSELESLVRAQAAAKGIQLTCDFSGASHGGERIEAVLDRQRVIQILVNLVSNAVKFTDEGGRVAVFAQRAGRGFDIFVRDTGRGIAAEHLGRIFDPFVQVAGPRHSRDGVGLGLATSRSLARLMGGDLRAESTVGTGSTFTVRLPDTLRTTVSASTP